MTILIAALAIIIFNYTTLSLTLDQNMDVLETLRSTISITLNGLSYSIDNGNIYISMTENISRFTQVVILYDANVRIGLLIPEIRAGLENLSLQYDNVCTTLEAMDARSVSINPSIMDNFDEGAITMANSRFDLLSSNTLRITFTR
jgi:hypothetical protein